MYYAQIDENGICYAVTQAAGAIEQGDMIEIASLDKSLLGKKRVGDIWEDVPVEPEEPVEPEHDRVTQLEQVIDTLLTGGETA